ncbi:unnamed protein product, partial [Oppiella nova]
IFQAKYQKRTYRDDVLVARNADQVEEYCRCVCGHLKCCYNLFSPFQFSGDDCPSNCRGLTKSNKYLKRAGYYRDKARHNRMAQNKKKMTLLPNEDNDKNDINSTNNTNNDNEENGTQSSDKIDVKTEDSVNSQSAANDGSSDESTNNDNIPMDAEELHKQQQQKELNKNAAKNQLSKKSKNYKSKAKRKRSVIEE